MSFSSSISPSSKLHSGRRAIEAKLMETTATAKANKPKADTSSSGKVSQSSLCMGRNKVAPVNNSNKGCGF